MRLVDSPLELQERHAYFRLGGFWPGANVLLKLEGLNCAGSIKIKTAQNMIEDLEERGYIYPGVSRIVESSSGNLGVALSIVCKVKGYEFTCVTDPNVSPYCLQQMQLYGARIIKVTQRDENGGFLNTRIRLIQQMLAEDPGLVWTNQYKSDSNPEAHFRSTAREIYDDVPHLTHLFVGAGTTGTLVGCAKFFAGLSPKPKIVAVDTQGSVTFGGSPGPRYIPGLGTSRRPEIFTREGVDEFLTIPESATVAMANAILRDYHVLLGGSTATVLCGVQAYAERHELNGTVVVISPDFGDKYASTIYNPDWVSEKFPPASQRASHSSSGTYELGAVGRAVM